jgi:FkbM family methyltransferase
MTFLSHAQNFEDVMLWRALRHVERGFWVDVGAADPVEHSVTRAFSERGWRGINIEPAERPFRRLLEARPDDINLQSAVGDRSGEIRLFVVGDANGLTTTDEAVAAMHAANGYPVTEAIVPVTTLAEVCARHVTQPVHFLKIDVEGGEGAVLAGADFVRFRPWIVLVESTAPLSQVETHAAWDHRLLEANYEFAYFDGLNRFYIATERAAELLPHFRTPPNFFDHFVRAVDLGDEAMEFLGDGLGAHMRAIASKTRARQAEERARLAEMRAQQLAAQLAAMANSTSWRLTRPVRSAVDRLRTRLPRPALTLLRGIVRRLRAVRAGRVPAITATSEQPAPRASRALDDVALMTLRAETELARRDP